MAQGVLKNGREVGVKMLENLKRDIKDFEREITVVADLHQDNIRTLKKPNSYEPVKSLFNDLLILSHNNVTIGTGHT